MIIINGNSIIREQLMKCIPFLIQQNNNKEYISICWFVDECCREETSINLKDYLKKAFFVGKAWFTFPDDYGYEPPLASGWMAKSPPPIVMRVGVGCGQASYFLLNIR